MAYNQSYGKQNNRGGNRKEWNDAPKRLPDGYLEGGYFRQEGDKDHPILRKEYILGYPAAIADAMTERDRNMNKSAQIRKYYNYCIRIRDLMAVGRTFTEVESEFCRLSNFVVNAESRNLVSHLFVEFIDKNIASIHSGEEFLAFIKHFEAVVAHLKNK